MGKKRGNRRNARGNLWQNAEANSDEFLFYRNMILQLAVSRFRWVNLPRTCDERFLERQLALEGVATIAFPAKMPGTFYSTKAVTGGRVNVYDNPSSWRSYGNNGWNFNVDNRNGVLIYDNATRVPLGLGVDIYARELVQIHRTKQMNRIHQMIPFILKGPQTKVFDMQQLLKQVLGGELAVLGNSSLDDIEVDALQTHVPYLGEELAQDETNVWNRIYTMLGIENTTYKAERQTEDEIRAQRSPTQLIALASLEERRRAARKLNERFADYLEEPIKVVWRQDNESENWNFQHNIQTELKAVLQ